MNELTFNRIPTSKTEQTELAKNFALLLIEGEVSPLEAAAKLRSMKEVIELTLKDKEVNEIIISEIGKYGKGETPSAFGAKFQVKETGVKYDFSQCNDPIWNQLKAEADAISEKMKEREAYLKVIKERKTEIDNETGEVYEILPPLRTSTTSYSITFGK